MFFYDIPVISVYLGWVEVLAFKILQTVLVSIRVCVF